MNEEIKRPEATEARWPRWDYKTVWTNLSDTLAQAKMVIAGSEDEGSFSRGGRLDADFLREKVGINPTDTVLEIGCGVGRVGAHLAPHCRLWIGCDVSPNMVKFARERLVAVPNLDLVETPGNDLAPMESVSAEWFIASSFFVISTNGTAIGMWRKRFESYVQADVFVSITSIFVRTPDGPFLKRSARFIRHNAPLTLGDAQRRPSWRNI
jgi:SAM-dependent methyltransferase